MIILKAIAEIGLTLSLAALVAAMVAPFIIIAIMPNKEKSPRYR